jgi:hypothetical protein
MLTSQLEAAGAASSNQTGGATAGAGGGIAGAEDCNATFDIQTQMACIQRNAARIRNEQNVGIAKRQIDRDLPVVTARLTSDARKNLDGICRDVFNPAGITACANAMGNAANTAAAADQRRAQTGQMGMQQPQT